MVKAKEIEGLDCGAGAARGVGLVLATRLEEMCEHRAAALGAEGEDGVHDMRVASRRLRSVLRDFRPYMRGGKRLDAARAELKRLARVLGEVRDEDVAIGALEKLKAEAPAPVAEGLELYAAERRARREGARAELARALEGESFESLRLRVASAFERATAPRRGKGKDGDREEARDESDAEEAGEARGDEGPSFGEVGRQVIGRSWGELLARGPDIYRPLKSRRLHKLRIAAKRLRYALELFAACYGEELRELAHELARLQTALGELHDCDGWVEECGRYLEGREAADDSRHNADESRRGADDSRGGDADSRHGPDDSRGGDDELAARREAAFWLLEHFSAKRAGHYVGALEIWHRWEREDFGSRLMREAGREEGKDGGRGDRG